MNKIPQILIWDALLWSIAWIGGFIAFNFHNIYISIGGLIIAVFGGHLIIKRKMRYDSFFC